MRKVFALTIALFLNIAGSLAGQVGDRDQWLALSDKIEQTEPTDFKARRVIAQQLNHLVDQFPNSSYLLGTTNDFKERFGLPYKALDVEEELIDVTSNARKVLDQLEKAAPTNSEMIKKLRGAASVAYTALEEAIANYKSLPKTDPELLASAEALLAELQKYSTSDPEATALALVNQAAYSPSWWESWVGIGTATVTGALVSLFLYFIGYGRQQAERGPVPGQGRHRGMTKADRDTLLEGYDYLAGGPSTVGVAVRRSARLAEKALNG